MIKQAGAKKWMADYKKEEKIQREKGPLCDHVEMKHYFRTKMQNSENLRNPHPEVAICPQTK